MTIYPLKANTSMICTKPKAPPSLHCPHITNVECRGASKKRGRGRPPSVKKTAPAKEEEEDKEVPTPKKQKAEKADKPEKKEEKKADKKEDKKDEKKADGEKRGRGRPKKAESEKKTKPKVPSGRGRGRPPKAAKAGGYEIHSSSPYFSLPLPFSCFPPFHTFPSLMSSFILSLSFQYPFVILSFGVTNHFM